MHKSIIITGASGNLGSEVVKSLSEKGYKLTLAVSRQPNEGVQSENIYREVLDLSDEIAAENFVNSTFEREKTVDAAILLVGGFAMGEIKDTKQEDILKMINVNFFTAYNLVRPLLSHFDKQGYGQIILVSSKAAVEPGKSASCFAYALSKQMLSNLAQFINTTQKNVVANMIVPSTIDTPATRAGMPEADFTQWVSTGTLAESIAFLLSDAGKSLRDTVLKLYNKA